MSKPNVQKSGAPAAKEFKVNPFAALSAAKLAPAAPAAPAPAAAIPTGKTPPPPARLDRASRELLAAMGGESAASMDVGSRKPKVTFQYERKGHGGKEVTVVRGLGEVSQEEQMSILQAIKKNLGVGAWFVDNLLLVQGDQTPRLTKWFAAAGYRA